MRTALRLGFVVLATLTPTLTLRAQPSKGRELLEFIQAAHRESREAIRTISCRVEFTSTLKSAHTGAIERESGSGRFWYTPEAIRGKVSDLGQSQDYVWKDSVQTMLLERSVRSQNAAGASRRGVASHPFSRCDAWIRGLLVLNVPGTLEYVPFEQLVQKATGFSKAERRSTTDSDDIAVQLVFDDTSGTSGARWTVEIHFDPTVNYLIRKAVYATQGGNGVYRRWDEVVQFKECTPGVFFPEKTEGGSESGGKQDFSYGATIGEIRVNEPIPASLFRLHFPHGIYLSDFIRGVTYSVDSDGNPISREMPLEKVIPPPAIEPEANSSPGHETQQERQPITRWILPGSFILLVIVTGILAVRRMRLNTY